MSFAFNFGGDDIAHDTSDAHIQTQSNVPAADLSVDHVALPSVPVVRHDLKEWLSQLPSQLSYDTISLTHPHRDRDVLLLPRRSLFDIRAQLMSEDSPSVAHLSSASDLSSQIYEGGFKTWESSLDLARLLLARGPRKDIDEMARVGTVVELGCGSAVPSAVLFRHVLREGFGTGFVLADYNAEVLRLVTLPNLLLTWALTVREGGVVQEWGGEVDVDEELVAEFLGVLDQLGTDVRLVSGPWGEELRREMGVSDTGLTTLVLAAETIYSPASLESFVGMLHALLKEGRMNKAYVAAKRFYFGVGGSVDALKEACRDLGMVASEVENHGLPDMDEGVGRAVLEVQLY